MIDVWAELDKRLADESETPAALAKRGECVYHPGKKVSGGKSPPSRAARKLGLCARCHYDTATRRKRKRELEGAEA